MIRVACLAAPLLGLCLPACGRDTEQHIARILAVTAPDSVGAGQSLLVKAHWYGPDACERFDGLDLQRADDTTFVLVPLAHRSGDVCAQVVTVGETAVRISGAPARPFIVKLIQPSRHFVLRVRGGAAPAAIERHRVELENADTGAPLPGEPVTLLGSAAKDTLAQLTTGASGSADTAFACLAAGRPYTLELAGALPLTFTRFPARCSAPERTVVRLTRP